MKFMMTAEEEKAMVAENAKLKAEAANKPKEGFFSTTAGKVAIGVGALAVGAAGTYFLTHSSDEEPSAKK